ncbi:MAG TPA: histidinol-phosphate transaminase [Candidatus Saccharimonadales bacterium]|nr:histidinol-phosphate transaminase [Candidatus Saccharimonadales bacterium]
MAEQERLHLQYGINLHADHIYDTYEPIKVTSAYPDPEMAALRQALAHYTNTSPDMIICGNGSDELRDIFVRMYALTDREQTLAIAPPTFYEYPKYATRVDARLVELSHDRTLITPNVLRTHGAVPEHTIVLIDSPSNPAGDITSREQIIALLDAGYTVIADEAYYEFYGKTVIDLLSHYPDYLAVSRTFSKFCAMSGSRLGYMVASPQLITRMNKYRPMFNVNSDTQARALYALDHMKDFLQVLEQIKKIHHTTRAAIEALGNYQLFSSLELYVIFKHLNIASPALQKRLRDDFSIETYLFDNFKGHSVIRATSGKEADMQRLISALAQIG